MTWVYCGAVWDEVLRWVWALGLAQTPRLVTAALDALLIAFGIVAWRLYGRRRSSPGVRVRALARPKGGSTGLFREQ